VSETKETIEKPIAEELAAAAKAPGAPLPDALAVPGDPILQQRGGGDYKIYREILRDDQVKATFDQRRLAVVAAELDVEAGGTDAQSVKAADFMREVIKTVGFDKLTDQMLYGVFYGYAVAECMWEVNGGLVVPSEIKVRQHSRFRYDGARRLRLTTMTDPIGELMPERKFWHFCTGAEHADEPYGLGLGHWLYWPVYFKRQGLAFWLTFLDKLSLPTVHGKYDAGAKEEEKRKLLAALAALRNSSVVITPKGVEVGLLEATRSATPDYASLADKMDAAISKITVGQTMTVDNGSSRSQAEVHQDVRGDLVKADADLTCESWNSGPSKWMTQWNFPNAKLPRVFRRTEEPEDLTKLSERDKNIYQFGYRPTAERMAEFYGDGYEPIPQAPPPAGTPSLPAQDPAPQPGEIAPELAEGGDAIDELTDQLGAAAGKTLQQQLVAVRKLLDECQTLPEFADRLVELYPEVPAEQLGLVMQQALAVANLQGRADFNIVA
jgi:phage gp29-like protein